MVMNPEASNTEAASSWAGTPNSTAHIDALDGIRGVAILFVFLFHYSGGLRGLDSSPAWFLRFCSALWCGVDLFFVLSGFLITSILRDARGRSRYYVNFYARRVLRIFPLFYATLVAVTLVLPALGLTPDPHGALGRDRAWFWFHGGNFAILRYGWIRLGLYWSLAVEEHFYLIWPWVVARLSRRALLGVCIAIFVLSPPIRLLSASLLGDDAPYVFTLCRLDGLATGAFLALAAARPGRFESLARPAWFWLGTSTAALVAIVAWRRSFSFQDPVVFGLGFSLLAVGSGALIVASCAARRSSLLGRFVNNAGLRWLGRISYGLYIFHDALWPWFNANFPPDRIVATLHVSRWLGGALYLGLGFSISVLAAWASWHWFESPILRLKRFFPSGSPPAVEGQGDRPVA